MSKENFWLWLISFSLSFAATVLFVFINEIPFNWTVIGISTAILGVIFRFFPRTIEFVGHIID